MYKLVNSDTCPRPTTGQRQGAAGSPLQLIKRIGWCAGLHGAREIRERRNFWLLALDTHTIMPLKLTDMTILPVPILLL